MLVLAKRPDATLAKTVAARLRGYLAERRISHKEFGEMVGWDRGKYQRRLSGDVALDLADLEEIEQRTPLTVGFLLTGFDDVPPRPPATRATPHSRDGGEVIRLRSVDADPEIATSPYVDLAENKLPREDSNLQPFG